MRTLTVDEIDEVGGGFPPLAVPVVIAVAEAAPAIVTAAAYAVGFAASFAVTLTAFKD